jgi:hypothetical protein
MATRPQNLNPMSPNGFQLTIQKLPELIYFSQSVNLPGISLPHIPLETMFSTLKITGTTIEFETLNVEFMVDESMANYMIIYNWLIAMGYPQNFDQYITFQNTDTRGIVTDLAKNYSDGTLLILGPNNAVVKSITYVDLIPISLSGLTFATTNDDVPYLTATASFEYNYFTIN